LLNNNKYIFGPTRRPIVQFAVENRRALQLKEQRRERVKAKQELLKDPTKKALAFESNKKKKQRERNQFQSTKNQIRLSELIQDKNTEEAEENDDDELTVVPTAKSSKKAKENGSTMKKRRKTKQKSEIRDKVDRMIQKSRQTKPQLPQKSAKKWFE